MNQPNAPMIATRTAIAAEGPDLLGIVRRYAWLMIAGTAVGAAVATGLHYYFYKYQPSYTASIPFQVLPIPTPIGSDSASSVVYSPIDDTSAFIHRQMLILSQEPLLTEIMKSDEFHKDHNRPEDPNGESEWLRENKANPIKQIKKDLVINPRVNAGAFEVTMTARDPYEAWSLVQAAVKVYKAKLKGDSTLQSNLRVEGIRAALNKQEADFKNRSDNVSEYAKARGIDVAKSRLDVEKANLEVLDQGWTKAVSEAGSADAKYQGLLEESERIKKDNAAHKDDKDWKDETLKPAPEMMNFVENDFLIENLKLMRNQDIIERAAVVTRSSPSPQALKDVEARIKEIEDRIEVRHTELLKLAGDHMLEAALQDKNQLGALADNIGKRREHQASVVMDIGNTLMTYQQMVDDLHEEQVLLNRLREQEHLAEMNSNTDETRVQQINEPAVPSDVAWPQWYTFIPLGTAGGLGLSFLLAYLLVLTDTRVRTPRDITRTLQLSLLGFVPDEGDDRTLGGDVETAIISSPSSMVAESFRQIRSHVTAQTAHSPVNTLLVASIAPGGGATTVAANLAASMAMNGLRVLLVDANFYRPGLRKVFPTLPVNGFADAIADPDELSGAISSHPNVPKLHFLGAGSALQGASSELFEGKAFRDLLEQLKSKYDLIIFDGAPLNLVSDSLALAARVDGVICVVRAGEVSRGTVSRVRDQLRGVHSNLLGFVLNAAQTSSVGYFKENYRTFYHYAGKGAPRQATVS